MKTLTVIICILLLSLVLIAQEKSGSDNIPEKGINPAPGISIFAELGGKGYGSGNIEFPLDFNHRLSFGLTVLDYDFTEEYKGTEYEKEYLTPGIMFYYLKGKKRSFFELGAGISLYPHFNSNHYQNDSPVSLHGAIGYRYQKKNGLLFRAGLYPFKRINNWFLPIPGVSLGYSW